MELLMCMYASCFFSFRSIQMCFAVVVVLSVTLLAWPSIRGRGGDIFFP